MKQMNALRLPVLASIDKERIRSKIMKENEDTPTGKPTRKRRELKGRKGRVKGTTNYTTRVKNGLGKMVNGKYVAFADKPKTISDCITQEEFPPSIANYYEDAKTELERKQVAAYTFDPVVPLNEEPIKFERGSGKVEIFPTEIERKQLAAVNEDPHLPGILTYSDRFKAFEQYPVVENIEALSRRNDQTRQLIDNCKDMIDTLEKRIESIESGLAFKFGWMFTGCGVEIPRNLQKKEKRSFFAWLRGG